MLDHFTGSLFPKFFRSSTFASWISIFVDHINSQSFCLLTCLPLQLPPYFHAKSFAFMENHQITYGKIHQKIQKFIGFPIPPSPIPSKPWNPWTLPWRAPAAPVRSVPWPRAAPGVGARRRRWRSPRCDPCPVGNLPGCHFSEAPVVALWVDDGWCLGFRVHFGWWLGTLLWSYGSKPCFFNGKILGVTSCGMFCHPMHVS